MISIIKLIEEQKNIDNVEELIYNINELIKCRIGILQNLDLLFSKILSKENLKQFFEDIGFGSIIKEKDYDLILENLEDFSICSITLNKKPIIQPIFSNKEYALNLFVYNLEEGLMLSNFDLVLPDFDDKISFKRIIKENNKLIAELDKFSIKLLNLKNSLFTKNLENYSLSSEINLLNSRKIELNDIINKNLLKFSMDNDIYKGLKRMVNSADFDELRNKGLLFDKSNEYRKVALYGVIEDSLNILIKEISSLKELISKFNSLVPTKEF